jgi:hypothetical protein
MLIHDKASEHVQVGEYLLRTLLFIHLDHPADKLQLAIQMLLKLYALVSTAGRWKGVGSLARVHIWEGGGG